MQLQSFIVATAGHVDHGKSALVKALTGTDPDRLPEEKRRGMTIDLGFAHLVLPHPDPAREASVTLSCGIVDVPGHADFVTNMVAGIGAIDLALFVVAGDDGWMPQTEEHLQILLYLGVARAVVALTKSDLVTDEPAAVEAVRARLADTAFADAPIVSTSVVTDRGLAELRAALATSLAATPTPADFGKPRLWVDRAFVLKGIGTVVTGTVSGGTFVQGDAVVVQPGKQTTRIRACHTFGIEVERVGPGTRAALSLPDVPVASRATGPTGVRRGDVIAPATLGEPASILDVFIEKSSRLEGCKKGPARPLKSGTLVRLHLGTANLPARVQLLQPGALVPGERRLAQLRLSQPTLAFAGDRFILRDWPEQTTVAGGMVLDPNSVRSRTRRRDGLAQLEACALPGAGPEAFLRAHLHRAGVIRADTILVPSRFRRSEVVAAIGALVSAGEAVLAGPWVAPASIWQCVLEAATTAIDDHHRAHPEQPGLPVVDLRSLLAQRHGLKVGFDELVTQLAARGFSTAGVVIRRGDHLPALPPALNSPGNRIREALARAPIEPPSRKQLAPDAPSQQALRYLIQTGEVVELGPDIVLAASTYAQATTRIREHLRHHQQSTASDLRQLLGTTRRILIPLLEKLDRDGVTVRDGDLRRLRS